MTIKVSFSNTIPITVTTIQGEKEAVKTAISYAVANLKVNKNIVISKSNQRKLITTIETL